MLREAEPKAGTRHLSFEAPAEGTVRERLKGATILLTGASGFLGKAVLATLLRQADDFQRLIVLLRAPGASAAQQRLEQEVLGNDAFADVPVDSTRAHLGEGRLTAIGGDLESGEFDGIDAGDWAQIDTVIHCAATVSFEEPLDDALTLNTFGPARLCDRLTENSACPHFVHVSTAYVADRKSGTVPEHDPPHPGLEGLDPEQMLAEAQSWRESAERDSQDGARLREFARAAQRDVRRRPELDHSERAEELRRRWVTQQLARRGRRYAMSVGLPDTYALSKALGERLLLERSACTTIVRPSIIESALEKPHPGWLEGIKVADPLILAYAATGLTHLPGTRANRIDIVPVDFVANACVAAAAHPPSAGRHRALSVTSGARNALQIGELADHIKRYFRGHPLRRGNGRPIKIGDLQFVPFRQALRKTIRREKLIATAASLAERGPFPRSAAGGLRRNSILAGRVTRMVKIYGPYTELDCVFEDSNTVELFRSLTEADRADLPFDTASIDWEGYLQGIHLPQVRRIAGD